MFVLYAGRIMKKKIIMEKQELWKNVRIRKPDFRFP